MKLSQSGLEVTLRDSVNHGVAKKYRMSMFMGVKEDENEKLMQNAQDQQDLLIVIMVKGATNKAGEAVSVDKEYIQEMDEGDFTELYDECLKVYEKITAKKNLPKPKKKQ